MSARALQLIAAAESSVSPVGMYRGLVKQLCAELEDATCADGLPSAIRALGHVNPQVVQAILLAVSDVCERQDGLDYSLVVGELQEAIGSAGQVWPMSEEETRQFAFDQRTDAWIDERKEARAA